MSFLTRTKQLLKKEQSTSASKKKPVDKKGVAPKKKGAQKAVPFALRAHDINLSLVISESAFIHQEHSTIVIRVLPSATKGQIKQAVAEKFGVTPISVRTASFAGKQRRRGNSAGRTNNWKKAYVKVDDISKISSGT